MNDSIFKRYLMYNGTSMLDYHVPFCKMTLCMEKATQSCSECKDPICNSHACQSTKKPICHRCRLIDWISM